MKLQRQYQSKELNWSLLPDFLQGAMKPILARESLRPAFRWLPFVSAVSRLVPKYEVSTYSQYLAVDWSPAFFSFLKQTSEPPLTIELSIDRHRNIDKRHYDSKGQRLFHLSWNRERILVLLDGYGARESFDLIQRLETLLQLAPSALLLPSPNGNSGARVKSRTVFVAHSFDDRGRAYAFQLGRFLTLLGFDVVTGEGYSPESISKKVRRRLLAQEIAVAIVSEMNNLTWLIQEATVVDFAEKPLFLLLEEGAEIKPGILGDLEYIRFGKGNISATFLPIVEGLREIGFMLNGTHNPVGRADG